MNKKCLWLTSSIEVLSDHQSVQAVEQDYEDEVLHEVLETSSASGLNEVQEWRVTLKGGHSRQHSRYYHSGRIW